MIISFTIENFLSIGAPIKLDFRPKSIKESPKNIYNHKTHPLLKSLCLTGTNASGKTSIIKAMKFFRDFIVKGGKNLMYQGIENFEPFLLDELSRLVSTKFEIEFSLDNNYYDYYLEFNKYEIITESLDTKGKNSKKGKNIFTRHKSEYIIGSSFRKSLSPITKFVNKNSPFISMAAQLASPIAYTIITFIRSFKIIIDLDIEESLKITLQLLKHKPTSLKIRKFVYDGDFGFDSILIKNNRIKTINIIETSNGIQEVVFDLLDDESLGTKKYFSLAGSIITSLIKGTPLIIDEFDSSLHPNLGSKIISLFNSVDNNPNGAQLIFTTLNPKYLQINLLRRDQQLFIYKKNKATKISSTYLERIRNDLNIERQYYKGEITKLPNPDDSQLNLFLDNEEE